MQSRAYNNFKIRERNRELAVEELNTKRVVEMGRISNKIQDMTVEMLKINTSLENIKKHSNKYIKTYLWHKIMILKV